MITNITQMFDYVNKLSSDLANPLIRYHMNQLTTYQYLNCRSKKIIIIRSRITLSRHPLRSRSDLQK